MRSQQRDLISAHAKLTEWLRDKMPSAQDLCLSPLRKPAAGLSNETLLCQLSWREGGLQQSEELVFRLGPSNFLVFPEYDLPRQFRVMQCLAHTGIPVPVVRWLEEEESLLGSPFYVMKKIEGEIPSEVPPYHAFGLCFDARPERRAKMWWSGLETLVRVHSLNWARLHLAFLGVPQGGSDPLDRQLEYYGRYLDWVGGDQPILRASLKWLRENRYTPRRVALCWGDARLPNLIYRDGEVVGVLDWEMAFLGDPEADLGWWIFMDWQGSEGYGIPRLEGFPSHQETVRRYEELTGYKVENLPYNEVFAAMRFGVIMARVATALKETGIQTASPDLAANNPATQRLATLLDLPPPGQPRRQTTRIEQVTVRVQFHLTGPGSSDWYLVSERGKGTRHDGTVPNPDVTLTASAVDWEAIQRGELDRTQAYLGGKLVIQGDLTLLMQLEDTISRLSRAGPA